MLLHCTSKTKVSADLYWYEYFSLFWFGQLTPEVCPNALDTPCMYTVHSVLLKMPCVI